MKTVLKFTLPAALLMAFAVGSPSRSFAQSDEDVNGRLSRMEDQMQQLMGQVEQLTFEVRRLQGQRRTGAANDPVQEKKKQATVEEPADSQGVEQIEGDTQYTQQPLRTVGDTEDLPAGAVQKAPGPKILGTLPSSEYQPGSNGGAYQADGNGVFQGQVLVPPANGNGDDQVQGK